MRPRSRWTADSGPDGCRARRIVWLEIFCLLQLTLIQSELEYVSFAVLAPDDVEGARSNRNLFASHAQEAPDANDIGLDFSRLVEQYVADITDFLIV